MHEKASQSLWGNILKISCRQYADKISLNNAVKERISEVSKFSQLEEIDVLLNIIEEIAKKQKVKGIKEELKSVRNFLNGGKRNLNHYEGAALKEISMQNNYCNVRNYLAFRTLHFSSIIYFDIRILG